MRDTDFSQLLFMYLEKQEHNNVYQNLQQNTEYLDATAEETALCEQLKIQAYSKKNGMS